MTRIIGLSGSLRRESFNTYLLQAMQALLPSDVELVIEPIGGIPLYNFDDETDHGIPAAVAALKDAIAAADGLVISTPEYNNSMPGVLKNAVDWLSRPGSDIGRVFGDKPVAVLGATPGGFGTTLAQNAWLPVLRTLGTRYWSGGRMMVGGASRVFDEDGQLVDDAVRRRLERFTHGFVEFVVASQKP